MGSRHVLSIILLTVWSGVGAKSLPHQHPVDVIASIPHDAIAEAELQSPDDDRYSSWKNAEVTGFITKNGDIFDVPGGMGTIESRQEPGPTIDAQSEAGMTMCRFGNIVVYSDTNCDRFFNPSLGIPQKVINNEDEQQDQLNEIERPTKTKPKKVKKKSKKKKNKRKSNKNNSRRKITGNKNKNKKIQKNKNQIRRKALKQHENKKRRQSNLNQNPSRRRKQQNNSNRPNRRRKDNQSTKRKRYDSSEARAILEPMQFARF